jgi:hypothetical protein
VLDVADADDARPAAALSSLALAAPSLKDFKAPKVQGSGVLGWGCRR